MTHGGRRWQPFRENKTFFWIFFAVLSRYDVKVADFKQQNMISIEHASPSSLVFL